MAGVFALSLVNEVATKRCALAKHYFSGVLWGEDEPAFRQPADKMQWVEGAGGWMEKFVGGGGGWEVWLLSLWLVG